MGNIGSTRRSPADDRLHEAQCGHGGKPFYAYVPFTLVHFPTLPNPNFTGKTGYGDFPDALAEMDAHVGEILDAIDDLRIHDNTICRLHERQRSRGDVAVAGLVRAVARLLLHAHGRLAPGAVHHPLAGPSAGGPRQQRDRARGRYLHDFRHVRGRRNPERTVPSTASIRPISCPASSREVQPRRLPGVRGRPLRGGEVAELEESPSTTSNAIGGPRPPSSASPKAFDLITDPKRSTRRPELRNSWIAGPAMKIVAEFEQSLEEVSADRARDA